MEPAHERRAEAEYTSPPQTAERPEPPASAQAGAGALGLVLMGAFLMSKTLAERAARPQAPTIVPPVAVANALPSTPAAPPAPAPVSSLPFDLAAPSVSPIDLEGGRAAPSESLFPLDGATTVAASPLMWSWPARLGRKIGASGRALFGPRSAARYTVVEQRLAGWFPQNPEGQRLLYAVTMLDGTEERLNESDLSGRLAQLDDERQRLETTSKALRAPSPSYSKENLFQKGAGINAGSTTMEQAAQAARRVRSHWNVWTQTYHEHQVKTTEALSHVAGIRRARLVSAGDADVIEITRADGSKSYIADPLVFDLKGGGVKTDGRKVLFDLYGNGKEGELQTISDVDAGTGILVFDADGSGKSGKSGAGLFGDRTRLDGGGRADGYVDGFAALRALVQKAIGEGVVPAAVLAEGRLGPAELAALDNAYGLKIKVGGFHREPISLAEAGVREIFLSQEPTQEAPDFDGRANNLLLQPGALFTRADGSRGSYVNVWLAMKNDPTGKGTLGPVRWGPFKTDAL